MSQPLINANPQEPSAEACGSGAGPGAIRVRAPAKLNLSLVVRGRRDDGFHELHTVMAMIDLYDQVTLSPIDEPEIRLACTGIAAPAGPENLVWRAAEMIRRVGGVGSGVSIELHERIPAGGGLGGGSSDAAATLLGLDRLWGLGLGSGELAELAGGLGSDVPFFLHGPVAVCTGRGEMVEPIEARCSRYVLLICPEVHVPTAEVYRNYRHDPAQASRLMDRVSQFLHEGDLDGLVDQRINMLRESSLELFPPLAELGERIEALGVGPLGLAGSGAGLFATSRSHEEIVRWRGAVSTLPVKQVFSMQFSRDFQPFVEEHHADF